MGIFCRGEKCLTSQSHCRQNTQKLTLVNYPQNKLSELRTTTTLVQTTLNFNISAPKQNIKNLVKQNLYKELLYTYPMHQLFSC